MSNAKILFKSFGLIFLIAIVIIIIVSLILDSRDNFNDNVNRNAKQYHNYAYKGLCDVNNLN